MEELFDRFTDLETLETRNKDDDTLELYYYKKFKKISPWHDLPYLNEDGTYNMVCEIPRYTRKKYEIQVHKEFNPICQDTIDGKPREYVYGDMLFNYGAIPQTWEDPNILCQDTNAYGDNDPLDIIDIGDFQSEVGMVYKVKCLGVLALIDGEELDSKVIGINIKDSNADKINDLRSVRYYKPGCLEAIKNWFENYKIPRGKGKNRFGFNGEFKERSYAISVINKCHSMWKVINKK